MILASSLCLIVKYQVSRHTLGCFTTNHFQYQITCTAVAVAIIMFISEIDALNFSVKF